MSSAIIPGLNTYVWLCDWMNEFVYGCEGWLCLSRFIGTKLLGFPKSTLVSDLGKDMIYNSSFQL